MRKLILGLAVTLDGYIEGPNGEYDWCFTDQDYGLNEFFARIDVHPILLGDGKLLFNKQDSRTKLTLLESKTYETGLISLRYSIDKG